MAGQGGSSRRSLSLTSKKKTSENGGPEFAARRSLSTARSMYVLRTLELLLFFFSCVLNSYTFLVFLFCPLVAFSCEF